MTVDPPAALISKGFLLLGSTGSTTPTVLTIIHKKGRKGPLEHKSTRAQEHHSSGQNNGIVDPVDPEEQYR